MASLITTVHHLLQQKKRCVLMVVTDHEGSSPGRKGFKMVVTAEALLGTIGGGIMEHKLVEYARSLLLGEAFTPFIKLQIHDKSVAQNQSGMICSGRQTIAFFDIPSAYKSLFERLVMEANSTLYFSSEGISLQKPASALWLYSEKLQKQAQVYIIGGGHVGLALSEVLSRLDFEIHILDHRENLNTMQANAFAHHKATVEFEHIEQYIPEGDAVYVVIMSFGYRTDGVIIRRLLGRSYQYLGMMGSREKIETLKNDLLAEGFTHQQWVQLRAPIGVDIKSETAPEIAISVAAELIAVKNKPSL
ncbi:XdhC family protein [Flavobacterium sp. CYK-55]|uniref:XdhC family protein n=1 Tax=Flavobacterium sp. CYK-55 TaxID=2835529 RepID=UPI001BCE8A17|nr:XdhC/CoxI family protein [Flavobacterium sp. CYK-55]MBS7786964.1 XdhC family protein [Flavobacterium sp. CYK-55]